MRKSKKPIIDLEKVKKSRGMVYLGDIQLFYDRKTHEISCRIKRYWKGGIEE